MTIANPRITVQIQNDSGTTIPPRSIVVVTSVESIDPQDGQEPYLVHHATKYTGQAGNVYVTGQQSIPAGTSGFSGTWLSSNSYGLAYSDDLLYVSIDTSVATPLAGEQWGPVSNTWTISRGGLGWFCQGFADTGASPRRALFRRDRGWAWGKLASSLTAGSAGSPTVAQFDIWHPDPTSGASPRPLVKASASGLQGLTLVNYDPSLTGSTGYYIKVERGMEGFSPYWVGCKA